MRYVVGFSALLAVAVVLLVQCGESVDQCAGVECDDTNQCTDDICDASSGECSNVAVPDGSGCDFGGLRGVCVGGVCRGLVEFCRSDGECDDGIVCTDDSCNLSDFRCEYRPLPEGAPCGNGTGHCHGLTCYANLTLRASPSPLVTSNLVRLTVEPDPCPWPIERLEFFDGPDKVGQTAPVESGRQRVDVLYTGESNGIHTLTARAYDRQGYEVTTDPVTLEVHTQWVWTRQFSHDARAVAASHGGSVYAVGKTKSLVEQDAAISKFDPDGTTIWTRTFGEQKNDELAHSVDVDSDGNVYVGGDVYIPDVYPEQDVLLMKYDPHGNLLWHQQLDLGKGDSGGYVAVDASGAVYLTGWANAGRVSVLKHTSDGTPVWSRHFTTGAPADIAIDAADGVYVVGNGTLEGYENDALFVVKYDIEGNHIWNRQLDGPTGNVAHGAGALFSGGVCIAGTNRGGLNGSTPTIWTDAFVVCYDAAGDVLWSRQLGFPGGHGAAAAADSSNVYVVGTAHSGVNGYGDAFLAQYDLDGRLLSIHSVTSEIDEFQINISYDQGEGVAIDSDGIVYVSGGTDSTMAPGGTCPCQAGNFDGFLAKHGPD